jgi:NAD(P)-dependent dehydrogenase (short-subunit alcohol dehydrogenase family)
LTVRLADKVVLITGAGSGLGRESTFLFTSEGAKVTVVDVDADRAKETVALVEQAGGAAVPLTADVSVESEIRAAVDATVEQFGRLDVMWANAGITVPGRGSILTEDLTEKDWDEVLNTNLKGTFFSCKHAIRVMKPNGAGTILCTSSAASLAAYPGMAAYMASKGGVNAMVKGLSMELGQFGIRINAICPTHGMSPNFFLGKGYPVVGKSYEEIAGPWDASVSPIPLKLGRPPTLRDNANVALFLVSDESAYMSGVCLPATDGGTLSKVAMEFPENWLELALAAYAPKED